MTCHEHAFAPFSPASRDLFCARCGATRFDTPAIREAEAETPRRPRKARPAPRYGPEATEEELPLSPSEENAQLELEITDLMRERNLTLEQAVEATADRKLTEQLEHPVPEHARRVPANDEEADSMGTPFW